MIHRRFIDPRWPLTLFVCLFGVGTNASDLPRESHEFFEKKVRPLLVERCFECHSATSAKLKGGLHLDSREGMLRGGDNGPAIVPGEPDKSLLVEAIRYGNSELQMPPKTKLGEQQIRHLVQWIKDGAAWPNAPDSRRSGGGQAFDLDQRRNEHWAWKRIVRRTPPRVGDEAWIANPVDRFIRSKLEQNNLRPAAPADQPALIRRLNFDLLGLPPTIGEVNDFLRDSSPNSFAMRVDKLLASPQFGERWARHWLDLVRYAETLGHEFDYPIHNAWRYRDYVIRAFNADLPYNQFVLEHIAGDLLESPRRHPMDNTNESVIGTAFFWLGQRDHSPVDVRQHQAELIDNQIDVMTKTFLGLTVACARCHDHKFDAISTRDFYSLYGVLASSRYAQAAVDPPERIRPTVEHLNRLKRQIRQAVGAVWAKQAAQTAEYLLAAAEAMPNGSATIAEVAAQRGLNASKLELWSKAMQDRTAGALGDPLFVWKELAANGSSRPRSFEERWNEVIGRVSNESVAGRHDRPESFAEFHGTDFAGWFVEGDAFVASSAGDLIIGGTNRVLTLLSAPAASSAAVSRRLEGVLRSPTFEIRHRYIHVLAAGRQSRINVPIDNFTMIRDPIYGGLKKRLNSDQLTWLTFDVTMWQGHHAYLEFSDRVVPDPSDGDGGGFDPLGYVAVSRVVFSNTQSPPPVPNPVPELIVTKAELIGSLQELAERYETAVASSVDRWQRADLGRRGQSDADLALLAWLVNRGLLDASSGARGPEHDHLANLLGEFQRTEALIPKVARVPAFTDGTGLDEHVFVRGNHKSRGERAPRQFLTAIEGPNQRPFQNGSGRLELAERMIDSENPLLARVMVNRVWQHLFGRGIVATPDDFGVLGEDPSHPELLDWLADWFRGEGGWSVKKLIRLLVTSNTYRMSSHCSDGVADQRDPNNLLMHRMPVRRLPGEAIRDAMLAVSGRLDPTMFGPPVPAHLTEFMEGRGRPGQSGPLDGAGRRSVYLEIRRNFLSPMMRTFDAPVPFTTVGRRTASNVPAQSLILMNDPFVSGQAKIWAQSIWAKEQSSAADRITTIYLAAFSRQPAPSEASVALQFLDKQGEVYGLAPNERLADERVWTDFCHVIFNSKEFIFIQ